MAFTPEHGALIVDSQYENEDQQFLEEIHLAKNNYSAPENGCINGEQGSTTNGFYNSQSSIKTYARLRTVKTEPMDYDEQTCSENGRSAQSFGEDVASVSESNQMDYYSVSSQQVGNSPQVVKESNGVNYNCAVENINQCNEGTSGTGIIGNGVIQEPGPIGEDVEERQDNNVLNGVESRDIACATWKPPAFRTYRQPAYVDWRHPRVRDVLRDYVNHKISSREGADLIAKITGSQVSNTTVRMKSRILDELDAQHVESGSESRCGSEVCANDGAETSQSSRENGRIKYLTNNASRSLIPGINAPIVTPPNSPYYLSFSRRFKQTSLTVPLNSDEVRLYRHASHSKSGRTIHFRCSRCDTLHQTYKTGDIARIKTLDGVVVSQLYPVHHERCKPIRLVEARAKEIERRCRKDIILGMNPKEAWKKGRKAAISEAASAGFPVYGPGSILSAFPEWDKVKVLFGSLRSRYIRRQMYVKQRSSGKKNLENDERKLETADFDMAEVTRPKRPWLAQGGAYSSALRHDDNASTSGLENVAVSEGEEIIDNDFELDDFEEESLYNFMQNAGKVAHSNNKTIVEEKGPCENLVNNIIQQRNGAVDSDNLTRMTHGRHEVERAVARVNVPERTLHESQNPPQVVASSRPSPSCSVVSASVSDAERKNGLLKKKKKVPIDPVPGKDYISFMSPAGVLPCAEKSRKYTEEEAVEKLRRIESYIARYNALTDNKIATIHMSRGGDIKMYGSKFIIDACLHSSVVQNMRRNRDEVDEEGVDDDELISIPLVRCLSNLELNSASPPEVHAILNKFLATMHHPWTPWFGATQCRSPDYWPPTVPFYDPNKDLLGLCNRRQQREIEKHSVVDLERDILKFAYQHYIRFMEYYFRLFGPDYDEDSRNFDQRGMMVQQHNNVDIGVDLLQGELAVVAPKRQSITESAEVAPAKVQEQAIPPAPVPAAPRPSSGGTATVEAGTSTSDIPYSPTTTPAPTFTVDRILEDQLTLFRNSVLRIRYDDMATDVRAVMDCVLKIQSYSTCRTLVLFADERNKLSLTGDKALISAFLNSNLPQCLPLATSTSFDNTSITLPLLQFYDDTVIDQLTEIQALELLEDVMLHVNFPWADPYDGTHPDCWPPEIPFCAPWSNGGTGILNRRIGANTPDQSAKVVLKSVRWFYSEMMREKLKLEDGLKKISPALAELTHNRLQERGSAFQTPVPRSASAQGASPLRVPSRKMKRSSSDRSHASHLDTSPNNSESSRELRMYSQPLPAPAPSEVRTDFTSQELPYHEQIAPRSPSQHSISSQETIPFRLPPHHPMVAAHLALQPQLALLEQQPFVAQAYESHSESYEPKEKLFRQDPEASAHSSIPATSQGFRIPQLPSQPPMRVSPTASWTSHRSSSSIGSRSPRSHKSSERHSSKSKPPESRESVRSSSSSQHFASSGHPSQLPAYNKPTTVKSHSPHQYMAPTGAALRYIPYVAEERTPTPRSTNSECTGSASHDPNAQIPFTGEAVNSQPAPQQPPPEMAQNPPVEQQQQSEQFLMRVLCRCTQETNIDPKDCIRCDICFRIFHNVCLPVKQKARRVYCRTCYGR